MTQDKDRAAFEAWLWEVMKLDSEWDEKRNCFVDYPAHLAFKAWQAAIAHERKIKADTIAALTSFGDMIDKLLNVPEYIHRDAVREFIAHDRQQRGEPVKGVDDDG